MAGKKVVVLGAGVGGMVAANQLRRRLSREHQVIVVERSQRHYFAPSFPWLVAGWREEEAISRVLPRLLSRGVQLLQGEVAGIDTTEKKVYTNDQEVPYDYLVMALGAELNLQKVPGLAETAYSFYEISEAQRLRGALKSFEGGRLALVIAGTPYK